MHNVEYGMCNGGFFMKKIFTLTLLFALLNICVSNKVFARESSPDENRSVELSFSINWTFGCYKETTFSNISQDLLAPRFQLDTTIITGSFLHKITADYFFCRPKSNMTQTALVYPSLLHRNKWSQRQYLGNRAAESIVPTPASLLHHWLHHWQPSQACAS